MRDPRMETWHEVPSQFATLFREAGFEAGMKVLLEDEEHSKPQLKRDWELGLFFSRFVPRESSLYRNIGAEIRRALAKGWSGAIVTLNYERLLEASLLREEVFPVVQGVQFYDDRMPVIPNKNAIEVSYPHGACHFFLGINPFDLSEGGNVILNASVKGGGVNHLLIQEHIEEAIEGYYLPLICRYEPRKSPSFGHDFFVRQRERSTALLGNAKKVAIIGVFCAHEVDRHLWGSLESSQASIYYVEPSANSVEIFRQWAESNDRKEGTDYFVDETTFGEAVDRVLEFSGLAEADRA